MRLSNNRWISGRRTVAAGVDLCFLFHPPSSFDHIYDTILSEVTITWNVDYFDQDKTT